MNKEATLNEIYQSAYNDELEKIAISKALIDRATKEVKRQSGAFNAVKRIYPNVFMPKADKAKIFKGEKAKIESTYKRIVKGYENKNEGQRKAFSKLNQKRRNVRTNNENRRIRVDPYNKSKIQVFD